MVVLSIAKVDNNQLLHVFISFQGATHEKSNHFLSWCLTRILREGLLLFPHKDVWNIIPLSFEKFKQNEDNKSKFCPTHQREPKNYIVKKANPNFTSAPTTFQPSICQNGVKCKLFKWLNKKEEITT